MLLMTIVNNNNNNNNNNWQVSLQQKQTSYTIKITAYNN